MKDTIPLQNHWENFLDWLLLKTELFATKYRYTLTSKIINLALEIQESIIRARFTKDRMEFLKKIHIDLEVLSSLFRRCYNIKLFSSAAFEYASTQTEEALKMVSGWKKYQSKKNNAQI